ncbi:MAG: TrwC relaxase [Firmicutes bacterium]|nr:TrwC relaxase [Bacillota bacterium]
MLSIANVSGMQAARYHTRDQNYYTRDMSQNDPWQGELCKNLSLPEEVVSRDFQRLVAENPKRAGMDLCFSADKSVSIAALTTTDPAVKAAILQAHDQAVCDTLAEIEQSEIACRVTKNGVEQQIKTGNMAAAKFTHHVSRNSDPQLHTHCFVLNKTEYNGKIYAIDNSNLYKNKIIYGQLYRTRLAQNLQKQGFETEITDPERGFFKLTGIDQATIDEFSSRRAEILEKLREWNSDSAESASRATILTRQAKQKRDIAELTESWRETINEIGGVKIEKKPEPITQPPEAKTEAFQRAIDRLENQTFAFSERELERAALAEGVNCGMERLDFQTNLNAHLKNVQNNPLVRLGAAKNDDGNIYYTTRQNYETEQKIIKNVMNSQNKLPGIAPHKAGHDLNSIDGQLPTDKKLSAEQRTAALHICTTTHQYTAVEGLAGTGKTYMLSASRQLLEQNGYTVRGAAFTGKAAEGLENDAKMKATTIHSMLNKLEKEAGNAVDGEDLSQKTIWNFQGLKPSVKPEAWIIDEAGLVDNRIILNLQEAAKLKNAKVILVGDSRQLQPVGIGNAYTNLVQSNRIATCTLTDIIRQKSNQTLLNAVKQAVTGDIEKSLELISNDTKQIKSPDKRFNAITKQFTELSPVEQDNTVILTARNKDRIAINDKIRAELISRGTLPKGQEFKVIQADRNRTETLREFSTGDRVIFLQNDHRIGVKNGQVGKIIEIQNNTITVKSGEKTMQINAMEYNHFDHGYAMTQYKAQGITVDRAIINIDTTQQALNSRNSYYVDISRARHRVTIYTNDREKMNKQVTDFVKKLTSDDFLIKATTKKPVIKMPNLPKLSVPNVKKIAQSVSVPLPGPLKILKVPLKASQLAIKAGISVAKATIKSVQPQSEPQKKQSIKPKI